MEMATGFRAVRNACPSTVSICRRSWRSSGVRDVAEDIKVRFFYGGFHLPSLFGPYTCNAVTDT